VKKTDRGIKVLFISAWYPHRYDSMSGLFVRKHAEAANLYCDVTVLYVHADEHIRTIEVVEQTYHGLREIIVYYPAGNKNIFHKIVKTIRYFKAYRKGYEYLNRKGFSPDIIHANILTRTGAIAYLYKLRKGIPYVLTEHWSRYLPQNFSYKGFLRKKISEIAVRHASAVMPISNLLRQAMLESNLKNPVYKVVDNVVDDFFFQDMEKEQRNTKRFLHISCFDESAKNVSGILKATKSLTEERDDFELIIIGNGPYFEKGIEVYESLNFSKDMVKFVGEKAPHEVAWWFQNSDAFILFSNYETAGVVIAESMASGIPVIATPTGIVPDVIDETGGLIVDFKDEKALKEKMNLMLDSFQHYDSKKIREKAKKFSYAIVGKELETIYAQALNNLVKRSQISCILSDE